MVRCESAVRRQIEKRLIPTPVMRTIHNALGALDALTRTLHMDTSGVIKKAGWELYEELQDRAEIEAFEVREDGGETSFGPIDDLLDRPKS